MIVINYYLPHRELSFNVELSVGFDNDLDHVERVTIDVIRETLQEVEGAVKDFEPVIRIYAFGDSQINLRAILRVTEYAYQFAVKHEFIKEFKSATNKEGIEYPLPCSYCGHEK